MNFLGVPYMGDQAQQLWFTVTKEYLDWAMDKPPGFNMFAYLKFKEALDHANRLEF